MSAPANLPNQFAKVDVTLEAIPDQDASKAFSQIRLLVEDVAITYQRIREYVFASPSDWIAEYTPGGFVKLRGIFLKINGIDILGEAHLAKIKIGGSMTLLTCRRIGGSISARAIGRGVSYLAGDISYTFDSIE